MKVFRIAYIEDGERYYLSFGMDTQNVIKAELFESREEAEAAIKEDAVDTNSNINDYFIEEISISFDPLENLMK